MPCNNALSTLNHTFQQDLQAVKDVITRNVDSEINLIQNVCMHVLQDHGKLIRPLILIASYHTCCQSLESSSNISHSDLHTLGAAVELIHNATLLHDDVIDHSLYRRGSEAAHTIFGNKIAILVGDYFFSCAFQLMAQCITPHVLPILSKAARLITEGEVMQLEPRASFTTQTYLAIVHRKTAALFEAASHAGAFIATQQLSSNTKTRHIQATEPTLEYTKILQNYGYYVGTAFQILDDIYDYFPPPGFGKPAGDDFREAKITLPSLLLIEALPESSLKENIRGYFLKNEANTVRPSVTFEELYQLALEHHVLEKSLDYFNHFAKKAEDELVALPSTNLRALLQKLPYSLYKSQEKTSISPSVIAQRA